MMRSIDEINTIPYEFICPITHDVMRYPMMTRSGLTFEREAILTWICQFGTCPLTRKPLKPSDLISNRLLKSRIDMWLKMNVIVDLDNPTTKNTTQEEEEDHDTPTSERPTPFLVAMCSASDMQRFINTRKGLMKRKHGTSS